MSSATDQASSKLHKNESLKAGSHYLRGTILEGLSDPLTGAISDDDTQLTKFHGIYQQDDRDLRAERRKQKLDKAYCFMVRVRVPGGVATPDQWLAMDALADSHANGTLKLTTRQAFQLHGVLKGRLKPAIRKINDALLDTIAACGDVNRNVMCNPLPEASEAYEAVHATAREISSHLTPRTRAYHEIWLDGEKVEGTPDTDTPVEDEEPIYGPTYLPRKFKIAIAVPPRNDVDVLAHDLGYIGIVEDGKLVGYNVTVGGGMGMTHGKTATYPRLADVLGFCTPEQAVAVAEGVVVTQRDNGDRVDRTHARLKYTVEDMGLASFRQAVEKHCGFKLGKPRDFEFDTLGDRYGWVDGTKGRSHLTLFIQNGRVKDTPEYPMKTGLREIAKIHDGDFRLTPNQNLILGNVSKKNRSRIEKLLEQHGLARAWEKPGIRLNSMACVALPTCGLALTESERELPDMVTELEESLARAGIGEEEIVIRMTGCPNGCARPYLAEIGLVGKAPGKWNLYLGAAFNGTRLAKLHRESITRPEIVSELDGLFLRYAKEREDNERFGDFCVRAGVVKPVKVAKTDFHAA
ncbi:MAG: NADPH-dependent assimilatory sulfite reductase hemoprotein subunit [Opitutales bacterium]